MPTKDFIGLRQGIESLMLGRRYKPQPAVQIDRPIDRKYDRATPIDIDRMVRQAVLRELRPPRNPIFRRYTKSNVANTIQPSAGPTIVAGASVLLARISEAGIDVVLLVCALFLQRFTLSFGSSVMSLDIVPAALIFVHQFVFGRLLIQYDRLLWFLAAGLAVTCSLLMNFKSTMLSSYFLLIMMYSLFMLSRSSTENRYKSTLHMFQFLAALLSFLAIAQFLAQFVMDGREIVRFYGIFPEFLLSSSRTRVNTIIPITEGSSLIKSNGIFLGEPSTLSQIAAIGILIEVLEFHRSRYLLVLTFGFLLSYSGTGLIILLLFLPMSGLVRRRAGLPALIVIIFALGLFVTGITELSIFLSRVGEFENTGASGFQRFVSPFWLAKEHFDTASLPALLLGSGPGTTDAFASRAWYHGFAGTWIKLFYEYGLIGSFVFVCFLTACFRKSRCPRLVLTAILVCYVFLGGLLLSTPFLIMIMVLCTLSGPEPRHNRTDEASRYGPSLVAESAAG